TLDVNALLQVFVDRLSRGEVDVHIGQSRVTYAKRTCMKRHHESLCAILCQHFSVVVRVPDAEDQGLCVLLAELVEVDALCGGDHVLSLEGVVGAERTSDQVCHEREGLSPTRDRVQQSVFVGTSRVHLSHEASLRVKDALQCVSLHRSVELATNNLTGLSGLRNRPRITVHRVCPLDEVVNERVL